MPRSVFGRGDGLLIERVDGRSTFGTFIRETDEYIVVRGTIGDNIGNEIIVPKHKVVQIVVLERRSR